MMKVRHEEQNPKQWQHLKSICAKGHQLERKFGGQQKKKLPRRGDARSQRNKFDNEKGVVSMSNTTKIRNLNFP